MNLEIVVARFREQMKWLSASSGANSIVYSKSGETIEQINFVNRVANLDNIGFEANTYLHHIVHHYDSLYEVTAFVQANPEPHMREIELIEWLEQAEERCVGFMPFHSWHANNKYPVSGVVHDNGCPHHCGLGPEIYKIWQIAFNHAPPSEWHVYFGAFFAVHRDVILSKPLSFWQRLLDAVKTKNDACAMERAWGIIMSS
jgi:hypothetical protein